MVIKMPNEQPLRTNKIHLPDSINRVWPAMAPTAQVARSLEPWSWFPVNLLSESLAESHQQTHITLAAPKSERSTSLLVEKITAVQTIYKLGKPGRQIQSPHHASFLLAREQSEATEPIATILGGRLEELCGKTSDSKLLHGQFPFCSEANMTDVKARRSSLLFNAFFLN